MTTEGPAGPRPGQTCTSTEVMSVSRATTESVWSRIGGRTARRWYFRLVAVGLGVLLGVAVFTFGYANGSSYLSNDPAGCVNCHVMRDQYNGWLKSSHGKVAVCNDCHAPHDFVGKWFTKAENGYNHSLAFTTGNFPDNIQIRARNLEVTEATCRDCHKAMVEGIHQTRTPEQQISCVSCHRDVGHL